MKRILLIILLSFGLGASAQIPINWNIDEVNPGKDITLSADGDVFTEGTRSCRMQLNSGAVPYLISDIFTVTPGTSYDFSIDVLDKDTLGQLKVYCDFFDALGHNIFGEEPVFSADNQEWQTIRWSGTVPPDAAAGYVLIKFYCQPELTSFVSQAEAWIDNCAFIAGGELNLVINGGLEDWAVGVDDPPDTLGQFKIFPNPAQDYVDIIVLNNVDEILITDLSGRTMLEMGMNGRMMKMDIRELPAGLYILNFIENDELTGRIKLVKN